LPESTKRATQWKIRHRGKDREFPVTPLEEGHIKSLWALVPWDYECRAMAELFEALPPGTREVETLLDPPAGSTKGPSKATRNEVTDPAAYELRNAAFHLLWHAMELTRDREPLTADKL
jgi:hypothetical protein